MRAAERLTIMAETKSLFDQAQDKAAKVAKKGASEVKSVATEALTAAASAAAAAAGGVVLERMSEALQSGKQKLDETQPAVQRFAKEPAPQRAARKKSHAATKRRKLAGNKMHARKAAAKTKSGVKARSAKQSRSSKKKVGRR